MRTACMCVELPVSAAPTRHNGTSPFFCLYVDVQRATRALKRKRGGYDAAMASVYDRGEPTKTI